MIIIAVVIMLGVGAFMFFCPAAVYEITQSWKNNGATEPSPAYIVSTKVGGAFLFLIGVVVIVLFALGYR